MICTCGSHDFELVIVHSMGEPLAFTLHHKSWWRRHFFPSSKHLEAYACRACGIIQFRVPVAGRVRLRERSSEYTEQAGLLSEIDKD